MFPVSEDGEETAATAVDGDDRGALLLLMLESAMESVDDIGNRDEKTTFLSQHELRPMSRGL